MQKSVKAIERLLRQQSLAVLGTHGKNETYQSLVAFTAHHGLKNILFATQKDTRKYENIRENPKVALLMDNRVNKKDDFHKTTAITALGVAREVKGARRERLLRVHAARHPAIETFLRHPSCALFNIDVRTYYLVSHFEHVQKLVV